MVLRVIVVSRTNRNNRLYLWVKVRNETEPKIAVMKIAGMRIAEM